MPFTLEALQANEGDCLILHYGPKKSPKFIVIDGGPRGIFKSSLQPRLTELHDRWASNGVLDIQMVMVSHVDGDHIAGVLDWTKALMALQDEREKLPHNILATWCNLFDEIVGNGEDEIFTNLGRKAAAATAGSGALSPKLRVRPQSQSLVASIGQGRRLRADLERLRIELNNGDGLILQPEKKSPTVNWDDDLKLTVLGPSEARVRDLQTQWEKEVSKKPPAAQALAAAASLVDKSIYNLSSIVVLAESRKKKILLAGDALADDMLAGLKAAKLLKSNKDVLHVDVLKVPHHGSVRNVNEEFFRRVQADHYLISADGKNGNPDKPTLQMIVDSREDDDFTIHLTNRKGAEGLTAKLTKFEKAMKDAGRKFTMVYRPEDARSLKIDLLEPADY